MSTVQTLRAFVEQRLTAAAEEIFGVFGRTISEYEEELCRQQKLLDAVFKPRGRLHRADVQQLLVCKEEPPHIKEEHEELWTNQDGEQRRVQHLNELFKQRLLTAAREDLFGHFDRTVWRYEEEMGRRQKRLDVIFQPQVKLQRAVFPADVPEQQPPQVKEQQEELWTPQEREKLQDIIKFTFTQEEDWKYPKSNDCSVCGLTFRNRGNLIVHMRIHAGEKLFSCTDCGQRFREKSQVKLHKCVDPNKFTSAHISVMMKKRELRTKEDKEKLQSSQPHQAQTVEMETEADGGDCARPEPARNSVPDAHSTHDFDDFSEPEADDSDEWKEIGNITKSTFTPVPVISEETEDWKDPQSNDCSVCGLTFRNRGNLIVHMRIHAGEKLISCTDCGQRFREKSQVKLHKCVDPNKFTSARISVMMKKRELRTKEDKEKLQSSQPHQAQTEEMETEADGEDCGRPEPARNSYPDAHSTAGTEDFPEPEADDRDDLKETRYLTKSTCTRVPVKIEEDEEKPQSSPLHQVQTKEMKTEADGEDRARPEPARNSGKKTHKCSVCNKFFSQSSHLKAHMTTHTGEKPYGCSVCNSFFSRSYHLKVHMVTHTGEKPYSCSVCNKCFSQKGYLKIHMRNHTGEKPYNCSVCNKGFSHKGSLRMHMVIHSKEISYTCPFCNKGFSQNSRLKVHLRVHTGEKPYSCHFCGKCFLQKSSMDSHMNIHTGEKPFSCPVCKKAFRSRSSIDYHRRIHAGQKPFSCTDCGRRFRSKSCFKVHKCVHLSKFTTEEMETEAAGEDCGRPEPARNSDPDAHLTPGTEDFPEPSNITRSTFTPIAVKTEDDDDDEEKPQSSPLHQIQTKEMKTEPDGETIEDQNQTGKPSACIHVPQALQAWPTKK